MPSPTRSASEAEHATPPPKTPEQGRGSGKRKASLLTSSKEKMRKKGKSIIYLKYIIF